MLVINFISIFAFTKFKTLSQITRIQRINMFSQQDIKLFKFLQESDDQTDQNNQQRFIVDKSMLILWIIECFKKKIIFTRPHGWGKRHNMNLIEDFFGLPLMRNGSIDIDKIFYNQRQFKCGYQKFSSQENNSNILRKMDQEREKIADQMNKRDYKVQSEVKMTQLAIHWTLCVSHFANFIIIKLGYTHCKLMELYQDHQYLRESPQANVFELYFNLLKDNRNSQIFGHNVYEQSLAAILQMLNAYHQKKIFVLVPHYNQICSLVQAGKCRLLTKKEGIYVEQMLERIARFKDVQKLICMGTRQITKKAVVSCGSHIDSIDNPAPETAEFFGFSREQIWLQLIFENHKLWHKGMTSHQLINTIQELFSGYQCIGRSGQNLMLFTPGFIISFLKKYAGNQVIYEEYGFERRNYKFINNRFYPLLYKSCLAAIIDTTNEEMSTCRYILLKTMNNFSKQIKQDEEIKKYLQLLSKTDGTENTMAQYSSLQMISYMIDEGYFVRNNSTITIATKHIYNLIHQEIKFNFQLEFRWRGFTSSITVKESLQNWCRMQPLIEKVVQEYLKHFHIYSKQVIEKLLILTIQKYSQLSDLSYNPHPDLTNQQGVYTYLGKYTCVIYRYTVIIKENYQEIDLDYLVAAKLQEFMLQILRKNQAKAVQQYLRGANIILRVVVGVYSYERLFKIYCKQKLVQKRLVKSLIQASDLIFSFRPQTKSIEELRLVIRNSILNINKAINNSFEFIDAVLTVYSNGNFNFNNKVLSESEFIWNNLIQQNQTRKQRNIRNMDLFCRIKRHLQLRYFFDWRKLGLRQQNIDDLEGAFESEELIQPLSQLLKEVQQVLQTARQIVSSKRQLRYK